MVPFRRRAARFRGNRGSGGQRKTDNTARGNLKAQRRHGDINSVNAVIRANPKYRASIKPGTKIITCTACPPSTVLRTRTGVRFPAALLRFLHRLRCPFDYSFCFSFLPSFLSFFLTFSFRVDLPFPLATSTSLFCLLSATVPRHVSSIRGEEFLATIYTDCLGSGPLMAASRQIGPFDCSCF